MGRTVTLRSDWEEVKLGIMSLGLSLKFKDPELKRMLLETGDAELIEGTTWHDRIWGICTCNECGGKGKNQLGNLLMTRRAILRGEIDD
jgi:ribA/ribD-fused uncharacterized protein